MAERLAAERGSVSLCEKRNCNDTQQVTLKSRCSRPQPICVYAKCRCESIPRILSHLSHLWFPFPSSGASLVHPNWSTFAIIIETQGTDSLIMSTGFCFVANCKYSSMLVSHGGPHAVVSMETIPAVLGRGPEQLAELTHCLDPPVGQCISCLWFVEWSQSTCWKLHLQALESQQASIHTEKPQVFSKLSCIINGILMGDKWVYVNVIVCVCLHVYLYIIYCICRCFMNTKTGVCFFVGKAFLLFCHMFLPEDFASVLLSVRVNQETVTPLFLTSRFPVKSFKSKLKLHDIFPTFKRWGNCSTRTTAVLQTVSLQLDLKK